MRIDAGSYLYQRGVPIKDMTPVFPASMSADVTTSSPSSVSQIDFTSMTRQQMFGSMSLDESTQYLGMTVKIDAATGAPVDMASDTKSVNFIDRARQGIAGALWRGDQDAAARLQSAVATMQRYQGQVTGVDIRA
jgi:hypothetical protein